MIIKIYKQRVKHLLYEHQNEVTSAKTDSEVALKLMQNGNRGREGELKNDKRAMKVRIGKALGGRRGGGGERKVVSIHSPTYPPSPFLPFPRVVVTTSWRRRRWSSRTMTTSAP